MASRVDRSSVAFSRHEPGSGSEAMQDPSPTTMITPIGVQGATIIQYADIVMDLTAMRASRGGRVIKLNATELRLLKLLLEQPERAFTREQLKAAVWGRGAKLDLRTISIYFGRLRRALNASGEVNVIRTITGYGYSIDATCSSVR